MEDEFHYRIPVVLGWSKNCMTLTQVDSTYLLPSAHIITGNVQPQSPASHCLSAGDIILSIGNTNAQHLTHMQAHQLIKSAGNMLQLTLEKCGGGDIDRLRPKNPVKFSPWKHAQPNYA
ncbi:hypothetical protein LOTGIDRAFT_228218 [Lottia gigantea]|uniref:PDZ domain-containing protein n=1 Tax=Lottia gigantea TaxID=225164 RepID=V4AKD7_LOTGI|nr:hypothetical protein LOTGIDRAFT_228218 [Lottia gigantea]ESO97567.1 hypothetical protein LOTGIDRAFT_228218 [Lottia gigantea]